MYHTFDYSYFFRQTCVRCGRCRKSPVNGQQILDATSVRRSPLIGTRILRETSAARLSPGRGFALPRPEPPDMSQVLPPGGGAGDLRMNNGRHATSDDDSGCALEEYAWLPQGLTPSQVNALLYHTIRLADFLTRGVQIWTYCLLQNFVNKIVMLRRSLRNLQWFIWESSALLPMDDVYLEILLTTRKMYGTRRMFPLSDKLDLASCRRF